MFVLSLIRIIRFGNLVKMAGDERKIAKRVNSCYWKIRWIIYLALAILSFALVLKYLREHGLLVIDIEIVNRDENVIQHDGVIKENFFDHPAKYDAAYLDLKNNRSSLNDDYEYFDSVLIGSKFIRASEKYNTTLAAQTSADLLYKFVETVKTWDGPISVAVYLFNFDDYSIFIDFVNFGIKCDRDIWDKTVFSLAISKNKLPIYYIGSKIRLFPSSSCSEAIPMMVSTLKSIGIARAAKYKYPQNHMRNLASKNCLTEFQLSVDIDIIPVKGMAGRMNEFFANYKVEEKEALIIPVYEISASAFMPENKKELMQLKKRKEAQPYHLKVFVQAQNATNFDLYESDNNSDDGHIKILHDIKEFPLFYEPFYISRNNVPNFSEDFVGYGFTRSSQTYEAHMAGFKFKVISGAFLCHRDMSGSPWPTWRREQNAENMIKFDEFKRILVQKYKLKQRFMQL